MSPYFDIWQNVLLEWQRQVKYKAYIFIILSSNIMCSGHDIDELYNMYYKIS